MRLARSLNSFYSFLRNHPQFTLWALLAIAIFCLIGLVIQALGISALQDPSIIAFAGGLAAIAPFLYQIIGDRAKRQESIKLEQEQKVKDLISEVKADLYTLRRDMDARMDSLDSELGRHGHRAIQDLLQEVLQMATANTTKLEVQTKYFDIQQQVGRIEKLVTDLVARAEDEQQQRRSLEKAVAELTTRAKDEQA